MNNLDLTNIEDIVTYLKECDDGYFNADALISDAEYDILKRVAFKLDRTHSYFSQIGSDVRGGKIKLPYKMGGLNQIFENEIQTWIAKNNLINADIVITDKLDGVSCLAIFNKRGLQIAYSRGNGIEAADITRHVKHLNVPKQLSHFDKLVVRAEIIVKNSVFEQKYATAYKTARGMAAGCMNREKTELSVLNDISFVATEIVAFEKNGSESNLMNKLDSIEALIKEGFELPFYQIVKAKRLDDTLLKFITESAKKNSEYELDGIVGTVDNLIDFQNISKSSSICPEHSFKYKIIDESNVVDVMCKAVPWELSKSAFFKPRIEINPVKLFGTIVTYTTGFNAKYIVDNQIGPGAIIKLTKAGSVIPYCLDIVKPAPNGPELPKEAFVWNESGVEILTPDGENHPIVKFKLILDFVESLKVDLLKEASLKLLFDKLNLWKGTYETIIKTIFELLESEWEQIIGANGIKIYESLQRRSSAMKLETWLGSLKYCGFGFGIRKAKMLLEQINSDDILKLTERDIIDLNGFDSKTAKKIVEGLPAAYDLLHALEDYVTIVKETKTDELKDISVVFTGFRDSELQERIESMGGKVGSGVSKKTTYLVSADGDTNSGKGKKARELGVEVLTIERFKDKFNL